jgi:hypothetical protein
MTIVHKCDSPAEAMQWLTQQARQGQILRIVIGDDSLYWLMPLDDARRLQNFGYKVIPSSR